MSDESTRGADAPCPAALEWVWSPWREHPARAAAALGFAVFAWAIAGAWTHSLAGAMLLGLATAATLAPWLVPQRVRLDERGVWLRGLWGWEARPWGQLRRAVARPGGVWISPFERPLWLDRFRALYLPLPRAGRAQLASGVRALLERHGL